MRAFSVEVHDGGGGLIKQGTGWLLAPDLVVTAFHVVGDRLAGKWHHELTEKTVIELVAGAERRTIHPLAANIDADIALLSCPLPIEHISVLPLADTLPDENAMFIAPTYPAFYRGQLLLVTGKINMNLEAALNRRVQLGIDQGSSIAWGGISGSPIIINGKVVGLITAVTREINTGWGADGIAIGQIVQAQGRTLPVRPQVGVWQQYVESIIRRYRQLAEKTTPLDVRIELYTRPWTRPFERDQPRERRRAPAKQPSGLSHSPSPKNREIEHETREARQQIDKSDVAPMSRVLQESHRLVVLGEPGAGKSTGVYAAMCDVARDFLTGNDSKIPVLIELADLQATELGRPLEALLAMIYDRIVSSLSQGGPRHVLSHAEFRQAMRERRFVLFLDGFNETPASQRQECAAAIHRLVREYSNVDVIVTSRLYGYTPIFDFTVVEVLELSIDRIPEFVDRYTHDNGKTAAELIRAMSPEQRRMALNPLVLSMALRVFQEDKTLPANRAALIGRFVEMTLHRDAAKAARSAASPISVEGLLNALSDLGAHMKLNALSVSREDAISIMKSEELLDQALRCRMLQDRCGHVLFWHQSVQEYFCVRRLAEPWIPHGALLERFFRTPAWWETLSLTAGLLPRQVQPIRGGPERATAPQMEFLEMCERTDPYLLAMALKNSQQAETDMGARLVQKAQRKAQWVHYLASFLDIRTAIIVIVALTLINSYCIFIAPSYPVLYWEMFHSVHSRIQVFGLSAPRSATVINVTCLLLIAFPLHRLVDWLLYAHLQRWLLALQHLGTGEARSALITLYHRCRGSRYVNPSYYALVTRCFVASSNTVQELADSIRAGQNVSYAVSALQESGDPSVVDVLEHLIGASTSQQIQREALLCLRKISKRHASKETMEALTRTATAMLRDKHNGIDNRRMAREILREDLAISHEAPSPSFQDRMAGLKHYTPEFVMAAVFVLAGGLLFFGPPDHTPTPKAVEAGVFYIDFLGRKINISPLDVSLQMLCFVVIYFAFRMLHRRGAAYVRKRTIEDQGAVGTP